MIVSGGNDGVRLWELASRAWRPELVQGLEGVAVHSVALGTLERRAVIVLGRGDGIVEVRDLALRERLGELLCGHVGKVNSVALGTLEGRPVIASGGFDRTVRLWNLISGTWCGEPLHSHEGEVEAVALGTLAGRPVIVSGGGGRSGAGVDAQGVALFGVGIGSMVRDLAFAGPGTVVVAATPRGCSCFDSHREWSPRAL